jgi:hypothetical protein
MSINQSNRVPNGNGVGLPNVSPGDFVRPAIFHKLVEGIDRATLQPGKGIKISKSGGSSTVSLKEVEQVDYHPFKASIIGNGRGKLMTIRLGQVFGGNLFNAWRSNNTINWAGQVEYSASADSKEGYHLIGGEIMIDIDNTNYISSTQITAFYPLTFELKEGVYYLELSPWSGREVDDKAVPGGLQGLVANFNKYSKFMKGAVRPTIKFAKPENLNKTFGKAMVFPICTVDKYFRIFQTLCSDIFLPQSVRPGTVYVQDDAGAKKIFVTPFTVNRIIPKMAEKYLDQEEAPSLALSGSGYVVVKVTYEAGKPFPRNATVLFVSGDDFDGEAFADTTTQSYYPLAKINKVDESYTVIQFSSDHLVVNRLKSGANTAVWIWDRV